MNFELNKKDHSIYSRSIKFASIKSSIVILSLVSFENSLIKWVDDQHALSSSQMSLLDDKS
jgi:hypothetical protein